MESVKNLRSVIIVEIVKPFVVKPEEGEEVKGERVYRLEIPVGAPYAEAMESIKEIDEVLVHMAKQSEAQAKSKEEVEAEVVGD